MPSLKMITPTIQRNLSSPYILINVVGADRWRARPFLRIV
jgi:hypothetical protein